MSNSQPLSILGWERERSISAIIGMLALSAAFAVTSVSAFTESMLLPPIQQDWQPLGVGLGCLGAAFINLVRWNADVGPMSNKNLAIRGEVLLSLFCIAVSITSNVLPVLSISKGNDNWMSAAIGVMGLTVPLCLLVNLPLSLLERENDLSSLTALALLPTRLGERTLLSVASAQVRLGILRLTRTTYVLVLVPYVVPMYFFRHSLSHVSHPSVVSIVALVCMLIISSLFLVADVIELLRMALG